ncbi:NEQ061 [Nanoarchaeum equitans Kin4-M]|uniref:UDP-N-acetylglucosamine--dolichyl-phosphate N-acetylglucosaminephosphotransferase n=1 Tax=Nanoarchaeum equitans (strain Kin4-M) TaxID=228908 RepID=Q74MH5_NANEQ|nr:NEQ061 [Nanoarchaeum equitans Kin4-M]
MWIFIVYAIALYVLLKKWVNYSIEKNLYGIDKHKNIKVGESAGTVIGILFSLVLAWLGYYKMAFASLLATFLGYLDDTLVFSQKTKLVLPVLILIPFHFFDFNILYILFMIFSFNIFNIFAGYNGLESGTALLYGLTLTLYFYGSDLFTIALLFSLSSLILYLFNRYPAKLFVGDSFTYFAGTVIGLLTINTHNFVMYLTYLPLVIHFLLYIKSYIDKGKSTSAFAKVKDNCLYYDEKPYHLTQLIIKLLQKRIKCIREDYVVAVALTIIAINNIVWLLLAKFLNIPF